MILKDILIVAGVVGLLVVGYVLAKRRTAPGAKPPPYYGMAVRVMHGRVFTTQPGEEEESLGFAEIDSIVVEAGEPNLFVITGARWTLRIPNDAKNIEVLRDWIATLPRTDLEAMDRAGLVWRK